MPLTVLILSLSLFCLSSFTVIYKLLLIASVSLSLVDNGFPRLLRFYVCLLSFLFLLHLPVLLGSDIIVLINALSKRFGLELKIK